MNGINEDGIVSIVTHKREYKPPPSPTTDVVINLEEPPTISTQNRATGSREQNCSSNLTGISTCGKREVTGVASASHSRHASPFTWGRNTENTSAMNPSVSVSSSWGSVSSNNNMSRELNSQQDSWGVGKNQ